MSIFALIYATLRHPALDSMLRRLRVRHPERERPTEENHFPSRAECALFLPFRDNGIVNRRNELNLLQIADFRCSHESERRARNGKLPNYGVAAPLEAHLPIRGDESIKLS